MYTAIGQLPGGRWRHHARPAPSAPRHARVRCRRRYGVAMATVPPCPTALVLRRLNGADRRLRDVPTSSGSRSAQLAQAPQHFEVWPHCQPNPKPGSRMSCSRASPASARFAALLRSRPYVADRVVKLRPRWLCMTMAGTPQFGRQRRHRRIVTEAVDVVEQCAPASALPPPRRGGRRRCSRQNRRRPRRQHRRRHARAPASSTLISSKPGRVDCPPMSMMSAPSSAIRRACATALGTSLTPSPENDSGDTLTIPMMYVRAPHSKRRPRSVRPDET